MRTNRQAIRRRRGGENSNWLSFSDLMSSLLLIFVLIMFYIMYQYFDMYEISMAEIARQQYDLDQANADLDEQKTKLTEAESQMLAQQIRLNAAQSELDDAESILAAQRDALNEAQSLLNDKEDEIAAQKEELDALSIQLGMQQVQINDQQEKLNQLAATLDLQALQLDQQASQLDEQASKLNLQASQLDEQALTMAIQQMTLDQQQQTLEDQQHQIEQLVGMKTRIIESLSDALRAANISAQVDPSNGSIALESDVLFSTGRFVLTPAGQRFVDEFLPVYLNVLFSDEYREYVSEIIIEGHTDSTGGYLTNLELSQQRALAVASYVLADNYTAISPAQKNLLREVVTANGRSFSDPVLDAFGNEDLDASRRVVFKFRLTDEQMIQQLKSILEEN